LTSEKERKKERKRREELFGLFDNKYKEKKREVLFSMYRLIQVVNKRYLL
jgi:hypothetical protein